ncbi:acyl-CoA dehydratase activase [Thermosulfurimonas dismutans]|uniref:Activator of 2-hydroxyglutaryl-CoA dehydratase n=1 Tax=Thermosulfurimonas dismutans TaxID=999894 RepID=A0A179D6N2_9BACT|nr:acyl-CoA dehydratase activase [Thermosulfurimonas dismutans]OAQ21764.1 Activator of 2-hydroxyglutaryl-CoA dehydratase [Thermosulfurimonas dismutans]
MAELYVGLDVGSGTAKVAVLDKNRHLIHKVYKKTHGQPVETAERLLSEVEKLFGQDLSGITCTGTAGKFISQILGVAFVNEVMAHARAVEHFHPEARTIIDIGGEDSKLVFIKHEDGKFRIADFALNTLCAAGTGAFLEQQAARLGYSIEEFSRLALKAQNIPRIAGRCTVFAKSDMIHLQQAAVPDYEIIAGLCFAIIRNLKSNLAKGRKVEPPVVFQGGVAANLGVRRAIKEVFGLKDHELIIPEHHGIMGAIGAALYGLDGRATSDYRGSEILRAYLKERRPAPKRFPPLAPFSSVYIKPRKVQTSAKKIYLGIDVGSVSTKLVALDEEGNVVAKVYNLHHGKPLESVKEGLAQLRQKLPQEVEVLGVGTTGSGRYLVGDFVGADVIRNEITAQAMGALLLDPEVDTIFEIGGQDSKYIRLEVGTIVDFTMNKACAAGTGSFLEEQAVRLGVPIEKFGEMALKSSAPLEMGERCTVFMQSDLLHYQQQGLPKEDLIAGLCYAIVYNYLNKVVEDRKIGKKIFFQGATAFNKGMVAAFEKVLGRPIVVPPHHEVTGAMGVALLAKKERRWEKSRFKGFDLTRVRYSISTFECRACPNRCEIHKVSVEGNPPYYYGGRCERYEVEHRKPPADLPNLVLERERKILSYVQEEGEFPRGEIGIPRTLFFWERLPFFAVLLQELGFRVILSSPTSKEIIKEGCEIVAAETCFPVKLAHGHVLDLLRRGVKRIFIPQISDLPSDHPELKSGKICPYVQGFPWAVHSSINFKEHGSEIISPVFHFGTGGSLLRDEFKVLAKELGVSWKEMKKALEKAFTAQEEFYAWLKARGREVLEGLKPHEVALVIVGRPYNAFDPGANLAIHNKIRSLGVLGIPVDMLPLSEVRELDGLEGMYWRYGQRILLAAHVCREHPQLFPVFITNFSCGPDSFIEHFFEELLAGKPYLQIEIDEHSADAGVVTRIEAFLDSIRGKTRSYPKPKKPRRPRIVPTDGRILYIPYMADHARVLAAAFRACGVKAEVLPEPDEEALRLGRRYTSGKECYPTVLTTGDMIKLINQPDFDPKRAAFFMPSGAGPCRFGQYNRLHRKILDELGYPEVPIYSPQQDVKLYEDLGIVGGDFTRLTWKGLICMDLLDKLLRETRPYEVNPGETERIYWESVARLEEAVERREDLTEVMQEIREKFARIPTNGKGQKPVVGIVGEIYVRSNRFANENIVKVLEGLGAEVWVPTIAEWFYYINYTSKRWAKRHRLFKQLLKLVIEHRVQLEDEHRFAELVKDLLRTAEEPTVEELIALARKYMSDEFEGEAILSVGKSLDYLRHGVNGIVNVIPFTCMPGTVVSMLLKRVREDEGYVPVLTIPCDGQRSMGTRMRIEAFMYQVREHFEEHS